MRSSLYQQIRLWSGIFSIGFGWVLGWVAYACSLGLDGQPVLDAPVWLLALLTAAFFSLTHLPFDFFSGHVVEKAVTDSGEPFLSWLVSWLKGQCLYLPAAAIGISLISWIGPSSWTATWTAGALVFAGSCLLIGLLPTLWNWLPGSATTDLHLQDSINQQLRAFGQPPIRLKILEDGGLEGANGMIPPFHRNHLFINSTAATKLEPLELAMLAHRERSFHSAGHGWGTVAIVSTWAATGFLLAVLLPGGALPANSPIQYGLAGSAVLTSWCLLALFVWPPLSHWSALRADAAMGKLAGKDHARQLLTKLQQINRTDTRLPVAKEQIFHPIPSLHQRLAALENVSS